MPKFVRQAKCVNGKRAMCVTKYETMCTNKEVTHEMTEDYPRSVYSKVTNMIYYFYDPVLMSLQRLFII